MCDLSKMGSSFGESMEINAKGPVGRLLNLEGAEKCTLGMPPGMFMGIWFALKDMKKVFVGVNLGIEEGQAVIKVNDGVEQLTIGKGPEIDITNENDLCDENSCIKKVVAKILKPKVFCLKEIGTIMMESHRYCKISNTESRLNASMCTSMEKPN